MEAQQLKVLSVADYYLPGFKGGGPIRTIANLRRALRNHVELDLLTRDRDLGTSEPYPNIKKNCWVNDPDGRIYYADPQHFGPRSIHTLLREKNYDIIYLNSFFSIAGSILINATLRAKSRPPQTIIAPRGEFSIGALSLKSEKKTAFLAFAKTLGLYRQVYWHVSSVAEKSDLLRIFSPRRGKGLYCSRSRKWRPH